MNILFITHEYYPNPSAITNCLNPIISNLQKTNNNICILTRNINNSKTNEIIEGINVLRVRDDYQYFLNKRDNANNVLTKLYYKIRFHLVYIKRKNNLYDGYFDIKKTIKIGKKIIKREKIDLIISCSSPFTAHIIASKIKRNIKWIAYQFDPYTYNYTLIGDNKEEERLKKEISVLTGANKIFITKENYNENIKTGLKILLEKYCVLPYPLIDKPKYSITNSKNEIVLSYAGTLYEGIREPFKMLDILKKIPLSFKIQLYYSSDEEISNKLKSYQKDFPNLILNYKKTKQECDLALASTNILLNIGNVMLNQTPSKVFELISLGKPIINFYTNDDDTSKSILEGYPLCYNVNTNSFSDYKSLEQFILSNSYKILSYEEATMNYLKKEEVVEMFNREVKMVYEDR